MIERTWKCFVTIYTSRPDLYREKRKWYRKNKKKLSDITSNEVVLNIKEVKNQKLIVI